MSKEKFRIGKYWLDQVPGSPFWYACWYDAGAREVRRRSLKTPDFEEAKIRLAALVLGEGAGQDREPDAVPLITVFNAYWTEHSDKRHNPSAARRAGNLLLDFLGAAAKVSILEDKQEAFVRHLRGMGLSVAYISRVQSIVAAALNRATKKKHGKLLVHAPEVLVKVADIAELLDAPEPTPRNEHPTLAQVAAFMDHAETTGVLRLALLTLLFAGRPRAIVEALTKQFDARNSIIAWNAEGRRQTKKYRPTVAVCESVAPYLAQWAEEGERFVEGPIRGAWDRTCAAAGVDFTAQSLRHFMATEMRKRKVIKEEREEYMGHRRRSTGDLYGVFAPDFLSGPREVAEALFSELETLCKYDICRQVAAKTKPAPKRDKGGKFLRYEAKAMVGATGIEPVTPAMSTHRKGPKVA